MIERIGFDTQGFAAEMQKKNIHVGLGADPVCVTCGKRWPCPDSLPPSEGPEQP